jgi:hypothetical protein
MVFMMLMRFRSNGMTVFGLAATMFGFLFHC